MDRKVELVHKRNKLVLNMLWVCLFLDIVANALRDPALLQRLPYPVGIVICLGAEVIIRKKLFIRQTSYLLVTSVFVFIYLVIQKETIMANYVFLWFGLIISSIYQNPRIIVYAGGLAILSSNYIFFMLHERLFQGVEHEQAYYLSLFGLLVTIVLVKAALFSEGLRSKAEENESVAVDELRTTKGYLESFIENTSDSIEAYDLFGNVIQVNSAFAKTFGWAPEEVVGQRIKTLPQELSQEIDNLTRRVIAGEQVSVHETVRIRKDGQRRIVSVTISPIRNKWSETIALSCISRDITDKKKTEELFRMTDKLNAVGQLAAGVAHEIRNPLAVIKGFMQLLGNKKENEYRDIMLSEVDRIDAIIREFLLLAKPQEPRNKLTNISCLVSNVALLVAAQARHNGVDIRSEADPAIPDINCDENQIKQVLLNLIKNAVEAMPGGGLVSVGIRESGPDHVLISIKDQGSGIPPDKVKYLGEPFFSLKENGTGLGLMVSYNIVRNHNGFIEVESEYGQGTTFNITLPVTQPDSLTDRWPTDTVK